jgi:hypothetical protein
MELLRRVGAVVRLHEDSPPNWVPITKATDGDYSYLSVTIGSTRVARRAGMKHAASATGASKMVTAITVAGSFA